MSSFIRLLAAALLAAGLSGCGEEWQQALSAPPPPGEKLVFVSSLTFTGNLGGVVAGDAACQSLADAAGLGGTFMAWLSDVASSPDQNFTHQPGAYVLVDGTRIADDWVDLTDGLLQNPIDLDENGQPGPLSDKMCGGVETWVLTGTYESGTHSGVGADCSGWTSDLGGGTWGNSEQTSFWSFGCTGGSNQDRCGNSAPIYCFVQ